MTERKYSVAEIDRMRAALKIINPLSYRLPIDQRDLDVRERHHELMVEEWLRTHMLNGTGPEELEEAACIASERWRLEIERSRATGAPSFQWPPVA